MPFLIAFESNASNRYPQSGNFDSKIISSDDLVIFNIYTSNDDFCNVELADPFEKYGLPHVSSDKTVEWWNSDPLKFYQNQLNFVTWCIVRRDAE